MKDIFLVSYAVKGIKTLEEWVTLSFYKKTFTGVLNTQEYNIKGIYGMNGAGKSAIITSVDILKNLLGNTQYLSNIFVQNKLDEIINKKTKALSIKVDYIAKAADGLKYFRYQITLEKDVTGKYIIAFEQLETKKPTSDEASMKTLYCIQNGEIVDILKETNDRLSVELTKKTVNLLTMSTFATLFWEKIFVVERENLNPYKGVLLLDMVVLLVFGGRLHVYMDQSDNHEDYLVRSMVVKSINVESNMPELKGIMEYTIGANSDNLYVFSVDERAVAKVRYKKYEESVRRLYKFINIFKPDLLDIEIDKKEDGDAYVCGLNLVYKNYKVNAEFESTGIKKLIKLYAYLNEVARGGIVFIDELDSNLHDVYLCALLEYLMRYGEGQLCFTTHNVGPMDVLRQHKKSIDFLSLEHKIYPWTTNGNYSPSKLYRSGMIEGSPFNVDAIDFIGVFETDEETE